VNAQELFLDVSSGRFLDGESTIPISKPTIFSDEQRNIKLNVLSVRKNEVSRRSPSPTATHKVRLGTATQKLADLASSPTPPTDTIRAVAALVTAPAQQAKGTGIVFSYTGVTATVSASIATFPIVTGAFLGEILLVPSVTASISGTVGTANTSITTKSLMVEQTGIQDSFLLNPALVDEPFSVASTLNSPVTATFTARILAGEVIGIDITNKGFGYPNGTYALSFSGGGATTTASANAVAQSGYIQSVSITSSGISYSSVPTVTLFKPAKALSALGTFNVELGMKGNSTEQVALIFPEPDDTSTPPLPSKPAGTIEWSNDGIWKINITSTGYGYANAITVGFNEIYAYMPIFSIVVQKHLQLNVGGSISQLEKVGGGTTSVNRDKIITSVTFSTSLSRIDPGSLRFTLSSLRGQDFTKGPLLLRWLGGGWTSQGQVQSLAVNGSVNSDFFNKEFPGFNSSVMRALAFTTLAEQAYSLNGSVVSFSVRDPNSVYAPPNPNNISANPTETTPASGGFSDGRAVFENILASQIQARALISARTRNQLQFNLTGANATYIPLPNQKLQSTKFSSISVNFIDVLRDKEPDGLPDAQHALFAGKKAKFALVPTDRSIVPTRYAVIEIECPNTADSFLVISFSKNTLQRRLNLFSKDPNIVGTFGTQTFPIGGRVTPTLAVLDAGEGYSTSYSGSYDLVELGSIKAGEVLFESPESVDVKFPSSLAEGFIDTDFSKDATISTAPGGFSTEYFLDSGGVGFFGQKVDIGFKSSTTASILKSVALSNIPKNYLDGNYKCEVQPPPTGTVASVSLVVRDGIGEAVVLRGGFGYTSVPVITAPAPNFVSGQLIALSVLTAPQGYTPNKDFYLSIPTSPVANGNAVAFFSINENGFITTNIENTGFGYSSSLTCVAPDPDLRTKSGFVQSLSLTNAPIGYAIGKSYDLKIQPSPQSGGDAQARLIRADATRHTIQIIKQGAGYTSAPIVTAPGFDAPNNTIFAVSASNFGLGYAPGTYEALVTTAPIGGKTAIISFTKTDTGDTFFNVSDPGSGYLTAPTTSVATPAGNIIQSISVVCQGSFYNNENIEPQISDASGSGVSLDSPIINSGKLQSINILDNGFGYGNTPQIFFNKPILPATLLLQQNQVEGQFNITTASANAILSTSTQKDIILEVFETDGTNEQVVAQATVSLAKRVLE